jgi:imidazolonepropionase-like amidohydrolase
MNRAIRFAALSLLGLSLVAGDKPLFIRNARIHTVEGPIVEKGSLLVKGGRISALGADVAAPADAEVVEAEGLDAYPGFMDAGGNLGLMEVPSVRATVDTSDPGEFLPQLQASTAVHFQSELIPIARVNGVTHAVAVPGLDGASLLPGQASAFRLQGRTFESAGLKAGAALVLRWPSIQTRGQGQGMGQGSAPKPFQELKQEQEKKVRELKDFFERAQRHMQHPGAEPDPELQSLAPYLRGEAPVFLIAGRARELKEALAFAQKLKLKVLVEGSEEVLEAKEQLKSAQAGVILGSCLRFPREEDRPYDHFQALAGELHRAGIPVAFGSMGEPADVRSLPFEGPGNAVAFGLSHEEAIEAVTLAPARMFGLEKDLGSLVVGKEATFFLVKGDPLEFQSEVKAVFIQGERVPLENRHQKLFEVFRPGSSSPTR